MKYTVTKKTKKKTKSALWQQQQQKESKYWIFPVFCLHVIQWT